MGDTGEKNDSGLCHECATGGENVEKTEEFCASFVPPKRGSAWELVLLVAMVLFRLPPAFELVHGTPPIPHRLLDLYPLGARTVASAKIGRVAQETGLSIT
jgi:hypothetical protein